MKQVQAAPTTTLEPPDEGSLDRLLTTEQAAEILGVSLAFLERDRWQGARVPYVKVGRRAVRYRRSDLVHYIQRNVCGPVAQGES